MNKKMLELTEEELFLIEMALDQVIYTLPNDSPICNRFLAIDQKVFAIRKSEDIAAIEDVPQVVANGMKDEIEELDFSIRTYNALKRAGIDKISQLAKCSDEDLKKIRNMGRNSFSEVKEKMLAYKL